MDFNDKKYFDRLLELSEENNRILRRMQRALRWGRIWRAVYWVLIIGLSIGAYYYIQPYLNQLLSVYSGLQGDVNSVQNIFDTFKGTTTPR